MMHKYNEATFLKFMYGIWITAKKGSVIQASIFQGYKIFTSVFLDTESFLYSLKNVNHENFLIPPFWKKYSNSFLDTESFSETVFWNLNYDWKLGDYQRSKIEILKPVSLEIEYFLFDRITLDIVLNYFLETVL